MQQPCFLPGPGQLCAAGRYGIIEDANNYIFNVTVQNATSGVVVGDDTNTGITVDNTIPQAATSLTPTSDADGSVIFSGIIVGVNTTSCTLRFDNKGPGSTSYSMTHSGDTCNTTLTVAAETYVWYIRASDETNTTDSSTQTTNVATASSSGNYGKLLQTPGVKPAGGGEFTVTSLPTSLLGAKIGGIPIGVIIVAIAIVGIGLWIGRRR